MSRLWCAGCLIALSGCRFLGSHETPKTAYDFGPPEEARDSRAVPTALPAKLVVANIVSPGWMDSSSMYYRLMYRNAANPLSYANSRWVMSPGALLTQRLRWIVSADEETLGQSVGSNGETYLLRGELIQFEQIFDQPDRSRGVLRLRASLEPQRDGSWHQRTFQIEQPAPTPNAAGGVQALRRCAAELSDSVTDWVADEIGTAPR